MARSNRPSSSSAVTLVCCLVGLSVGLSVGTLATEASAFGLGGYVEYVGGEGEVDLFGLGDVDFDVDKVGVGFALDTNLASDRVFNYRMTIGYQSGRRDFDRFTAGGFTFDLGDLDSDGFSFNNAFGFALARGPEYRVWAGPAIRLGIDVFDTDDDDIDIVDFSAGIGPVVGLNIHVSDEVTLGITAGYQYLHITEIVDVDFAGANETDDFEGHEHVGMVNFAVFFRTAGDRFYR